MDMQTGRCSFLDLPDVSVDTSQQFVAFDISEKPIAMMTQIDNRYILTILGLVVKSQEQNQVSGSSLVRSLLQLDSSSFQSVRFVFAIHAESPVVVQLIDHDDMNLSSMRSCCAYAIFTS
ncbi:hypothetical protein ACQUWW_26785, partial [Ralstonia pseudosolanacearum]|uniref:hypothetical protein n=1 Tax=Ralstonia pseudosolanacearum TaxID=1310165 RepID=UPI003D167B17